MFKTMHKKCRSFSIYCFCEVKKRHTLKTFRGQLPINIVSFDVRASTVHMAGKWQLSPAHKDELRIRLLTRLYSFLVPRQNQNIGSYFLLELFHNFVYVSVRILDRNNKVVAILLSLGHSRLDERQADPIILFKL